MKNLIFLLIVLCFSQVGSADVIFSHRCKQAAESAGININFDGEQVDIVRDWLVKCAPRFKRDLLKNKYMHVYLGPSHSRKIMFPLLGIVEFVEDEESEYGQRIEYSNPLNYHMNVEAIVEDPEGYPGDVPEDYEIMAYCGR